MRFDPEKITLSQILRRAAEVGYRAVPFDASKREAHIRYQTRVLLQRLFLAALAMMQVMMYALPAYLSDTGEIEQAYVQLMRWASLTLTVPVMLYSAQPFFSGAWRDIRALSPGMDVPVVIGLLAAFIASVWATITGEGEIYFDSVSMFVFLLLGARYLEWTARRRAMRAVDDLAAARPETAHRLETDAAGLKQPVLVPAARLQPDDLIKVASGEHIPVDSNVESGSSAIDQSLLTGESIPVPVSVGDLVPGGALLAGAPLVLRVQQAQSSSVLSVIEALVDRSAAEKPRLARLADQVASRFVTALLLFAPIVWLFWHFMDPVRAWPVAIAVLVVSCPCALSLATPAALAAATGSLLRSHMLITRGHALETLAGITDVVFDKTGTLTTGQPSLTHYDVFGSANRLQVLQVAASMEAGAAHPFARALISAAARSPTAHGPIERGPTTSSAVNSVSHEAGFGIGASYTSAEGKLAMLRLGSAGWCGLGADDVHMARSKASSDSAAASEVFLCEYSTHVSQCSQTSPGEPCLLARFTFADTLRTECDDLITTIRSLGLQIHLLSGDHEQAVAAVANRLGIDKMQSSAAPAAKRHYVQALQRTGATVLMIGDGINDAPVLAAADVSIAVGSATSLARTAADVISLQPGIRGIALLLYKARHTQRIIRQNLLWAALYNLIAIPAAAMGFIPPWAAAIGMAVSSLLVAGNAIRLWAPKAGGLAALPMAAQRKTEAI